jgi:hypothetical protein
MKRIVTVFACALVVGGFQAHRAEAQTIGFKLGSTWSKQDVDPQDEDETTDLLSAFGGGGFVRFGFAGLALQTEVLAVTKGTKSEDLAGADIEMKLDYIEVPVTALFAVGNGPYVFVGPSFAWDITDDDEAPGLPARKKFDVGVTGGLGVQFPAGPGALLVEGRYTHGFTNLNDTATRDDVKVRNRSFAAFAGYAISIGSR